jgi:class 3 adenylate cyclase/tetratricopeptide (TPR) repeat protein
VDIAAWLRELGLERYASAFRDNEIDAEILPKLIADDLRDIGVIAVGHRRKLLEAIAALTAADAPPPTQRAAARTRAERRQLTTLFCDLVGSSALSARLDPEDLSQLIQAYQACCEDIVKRWDGHVHRHLGDGVLAYFGYPSAHEDDAERAVRAGLDLTAAVGQLRTEVGEPLAARVGIATGVVMVGELAGGGAAQKEEVVGKTPNLAARLQALAEPGSVVIAASTRRLLGGLFELTDLGPVCLKGFAEPHAAWRVVGEGHAEGRFEALRGQQVTPLVGRKHELAILMERWAWAKHGDGQVVLISGEPGIGKSRIVRALHDRLAGEPYVALNHFCSPYHTNSALYPIITRLERSAAFARDDAPEAKLAKLEGLLGRATDQLDEAVPLIAALLGVPTGERYPALNLSPQRQKQRTLEVLLEQLEGLTRDKPVLELYEDAHWMDPSTLELLDLLVDRVCSLPVLVVLSYRLEFSPTWIGQSHVTALPLNRLGRCQSAALALRVSGKALPDEVLNQIEARTDGVPIFVEELTKTVLESDLLTDAGDHYELRGPLTSLAIPETLRDSLMARLDRLAPIKEVVQIGAVMGREFSHDLLAAVSPLSTADLCSALNQLISSELIFRRGSPPSATYGFKHALIEEVAYSSLPRQDRRKYHSRAAEVLCAQAGDLVRIRPELVARHYSLAGEELLAFDAWLEAGRAAMRRSANDEALGHLRNAEGELLKLKKLKGKRPDDRWVKLHMARGPVLIARYGWAHPQVEQAYRSALKISARSGARDRDLFDVWRGLYNVHLLRGDLRSARGVATRLHWIATKSGDRDLLLGSHRAVGLCDFLGGKFGRANKHLEEAIALYDPAQHRQHAFVQGVDPVVIAYSINAWALWFLGDLDRAAQHSGCAIEAAQPAEHPFSMAYALCLAASLAQCGGRTAEAVSVCDAALKLAMDHAFPYWHAWASIVKGWALVELGDRSAGVRMLEDGLNRYAETGAAQMRSYGLCLLAQARQRARLRRKSAEAAWAAIAEAERSGVTFYLAEAYRLSGEALCQIRPKKAAGLRMLLRAVRVAVGQRSCTLLARTRTTQRRMRQRCRVRRAPEATGFG